MKTKINILLIVLFCIGQNVFGQCAASFSSSQNLMTTTFNNNSVYSGTVNPVVTTYTWDFGDGNTTTSSNSLIVRHTYAGSGTYNVTLTMNTVDSINNNMPICSDVITQPVVVNQSCATSFGSFNTQNYYSFSTSTVSIWTNPAISAEYDWDFGDGTTQLNGGTNANHTYTVIGTYNACLTIKYLGLNNTIICTDTYCVPVNITTLTSPTCAASYTYTLSANGTAYFSNISSLSPLVNGISYSYTYDFGDGSPTYTSSNTGPVTHSYSTSGTFNACLIMTAYDSITNNVVCNNTYCNSVTVNPTFTGCAALFTSAADTVVGNNTYHFNASPSYVGAANTIVSYAWDFGDNSTGTGATPSHSYSTSGLYNVCLTITSSNSCTDTYCLLLNVQNLVPNTNNNYLFGTVVPAGEAMVYLIEYNSTSQSLSAVGTVVSDANSGNFYGFSNFSTSPLLIKAAYNIYDQNYSTHLPTYYNGNALWSGGTNVTVPSNSSQNIIINMLSGTPMVGPGFIGGSVLTGANKTAGVGDPKVNLTVLLFDVNTNQFVTYTRTDINGEYSFDNIPNGTYKVFLEELGKTMTAADIVVNGSNTTFNNIHFESNSTENHPAWALSTNNWNNRAIKYALSQNPVNESFEIHGLQGNEIITLLNMNGQIVQSYKNNVAQTEFEVGNVQAGLYILNIRTEQQQKNIKLVVTH